MLYIIREDYWRPASNFIFQDIIQTHKQTNRFGQKTPLIL